MIFCLVIQNEHGWSHMISQKNIALYEWCSSMCLHTHRKFKKCWYNGMIISTNVNCDGCPYDVSRLMETK